MADVTTLEITQIDPNPQQPRRAFRELEALAASIREHGVLEPVMVRPHGTRYALIHEERRWRAARLAGLITLPAVVRPATDAEAFRLALVENVQRAALTPVEEAEAYARLHTQGMTQAQMAALVGRTQSYIAHKLQLLRLPPPLAFYVQEGALTENHGRQIMTLRPIYPVDRVRVVAEDPARGEAIGNADGVWLNAWRPEDSPCWWFGSAIPPVVREGSHHWAAYVAQHRDTGVPQWEAAAFWWGTAAATGDWPVTHLAHALHTGRERWEHAVVWWTFLHHLERPGPTGRPLTAAERDPHDLWWAYWADLRHSGSLAFATALASTPPEDRTTRFPRLPAIVHAMAQHGSVVPSRWHHPLVARTAEGDRLPHPFTPTPPG